MVYSAILAAYGGATVARRFLRGNVDGSVLSWDEPLCPEHPEIVDRPAFLADRGAGTYMVDLPCGHTATVGLHFEEVPEGQVVEVPDPVREAEMAQFLQFQQEQFEAWKASRAT